MNAISFLQGLMAFIAVVGALLLIGLNVLFLILALNTPDVPDADVLETPDDVKPQP
jgi:hypothetical protein